MSRSQTPMNLDVAVGINDGAYFIGRKEILEFLNSQLDMNLEKIEQTASGAVACQLMDKFFPGSIQIKRVNWEAKSDFQYIENYKILQAAFSTCNIQKHIDVDRLVRAKYQDNLEFCQWLKAFFEQVASANSNDPSSSRDTYDPLARRMLGKGGSRLDPIFMPSKARTLNKSRPHTSGGVSNNTTHEIPPVGRASLGNFITASTVLSTSTNVRRSSVATTATVGSISSTATTTTTTAVKRNISSSKPPMPVVGVNTASPSQNNVDSSTTTTHKNKRVAVMKENTCVASKEGYVIDLDTKVNQLIHRNAELQLQLELAENERNFYFEKLRGIELMLQIHEEANGTSNLEKLVSDISQVVCAKVEDEVFVSDEGQVQKGEQKMLDDFSSDALLNGVTKTMTDEALVTEAESY